jgi:nucleoside-diphosphate kinase
MMERTFALIKSAAIIRRNVPAIRAMIREGGMRVVLMKFFSCPIEADSPFRSDTQGSLEKFEELYKDHKGKPYWDILMKSVCPGSYAMLIEGDNAIAKWRHMMGPTDPAKARLTHPQSIRALYGAEIPDNATHGSDSQLSAIRETNIFFPGAYYQDFTGADPVGAADHG